MSDLDADDQRRIIEALRYLARELHHRSFSVIADRRQLLWQEMDRCLLLAQTLADSMSPPMASGITVTSNPDPAMLQSLGVTSWPTWGCEISTFPWTYDEQETCLLLEGDVTVTPEGGEPVRFGAGDLVVFDAGLSCTWQVHAHVRKHYRFG
jgi:uncharacterized cupin superfamily protein